MESDNENSDGATQASQAAPSCGPVRQKRKRTMRASASQVDELIAKLEGRPFLASKRFTGLQGRQNYESAWREVAQQLNELNGARTTAEQWMTVWRDIKSRACTKAAKLNRERNETGNRAVTTCPLTELEKRIISIIGQDYVTGTSCPDSMPEEDQIQQLLETGVVIDIPVNNNLDNYVEFQEIDTESEAQVPPESEAQVPPAMHNVETIADVHITPRRDNSGRQPEAGLSTSERQASRATERQARPVRRNLNPRLSVSEQHSSARADFLLLAQSNADSMSILANAAQVQAEVARKRAETDRMRAESDRMRAECDRMRAENERMLAEAVNRIADAIMLHVAKQ